MTEAQILELMTNTLRDLIGDETIVLGVGTRRADVPGWDSFTYVNFIVAIEMALGIKFGIADVESFATVGDVVAEARRLLG